MDTITDYTERISENIMLLFSNNRTFPLIAILCFTVETLILAIIPPAGGYEYSVYNAYPPVFWVLIIFLFLLPLGYIVVSKKEWGGVHYQKKTIIWLVIISLATLMLILYLPLIRGDVIHYSGDTLSHLGAIHEILSNGYLHPTHYPYIYVFGTIFTLILGITNQDISFQFIPIFSCLFIIGVLCSARSLRLSHIHVMAITSLSIVPIVAWITMEGIMPSTIGWQLLPLFIYLTYTLICTKENKIEYLILATIFTITLWFVHPETTIYTTALLVTAGLVIGFYAIFMKEKISISFGLLFYLFIISIMGYLYFISMTAIFQGQLLLYSNFISDFLTAGTMGEDSPFNIQSSTTPFIDRLIGFILGNLGYIIILSISGVTILSGLKSRLFRQPIFLIIAAVFIVFFILSIGFMFSGSGIACLQRQLKYPMLISLFLCGFYFVDLLSHNNKHTLKKILSIVVVIGIICASIFSVLTLYGNPSLTTQNKQTTYQDVSGMELFYTYSNQGSLVVETGIREHQERYLKYLYGGSMKMENIRDTFDDNIIVPSHLGYDTLSYFGNNYDRVTYYLKYPPIGGFHPYLTSTIRYWGDISPTDYIHLDFDTTANFIQNGGDLEVYIIVPR